MAKDESRQIGVSYGLTDISDGNKQQEFSTFGVSDYSMRLTILLTEPFVDFMAAIAKIRLLTLAQAIITVPS